MNMSFGKKVKEILLWAMVLIISKRVGDLLDSLTRHIKSDYFKRWSPLDFSRWVIKCLEVASVELEENLAYYRHRCLKKIREEAYPISIFLDSKLLDVKIQPLTFVLVLGLCKRF